MKNTIRFAAFILSLSLLACGGGEHSATDTGSASFGLTFEEASAPAAMKLAPSMAPADICSSYGITSISGTVYNSSNTVIATGGPWACSAHQGTIYNIPTGSNIRIAIKGTVSGAVVWQGETTGKTIYSGQDTNVGSIPMAYTGNDTTRPTVTAATPTGTTVPLTSPITVTFSESMAASTIDTTTFTLKNGSVAVPGSVSYNSTTKTATFTPTSSLSNSVIYTATVTTDVTDMAANKMQSLYTWDITTEAPPTSAPTAPTGVTTTTADKQVTVSWTAVTGATSYNIYWSTTSGVTKTTGTKITGATSPYTHTGLTNGTIYYYVVTAVNSYGESGESTQLSATPTSGSTTDTTSPSNPTATSGYDGFGKASSITSGNWYNYTAPYFEWSGASDSGSGVAGYYVYFGTSITADPAVSGTYQATANYTVSATLTSGSTYYLLIKAKDSSGNIAASTYRAYMYNYESTVPTDGNLAATNGNGTIITLNWSGFSDNISGVGSYKLVYSTTGTPTSCGDGTQIYTGTSTSYSHTGLTNGTTYYYRVCATDNAGNMSVGATVAVTPGWTVSILDSTGLVGKFNSLAVDTNNKGHISYYDETNKYLKYATNLSGAWLASIVDSNGDVGQDSATTIDTNNKIHISYHDRSSNWLKYANNVQGSWSRYNIYPLGINGGDTDIAVATNTVYIIFRQKFDTSENFLEYVYSDFNGNRGAVMDIDYSGNTGGYSSIAIDISGSIHVSYFDFATGDLKYVNSALPWVKTVIDSQDNVGLYTSLAIDINDKVHISYYDGTNGDLKYATNVSGMWITSVIDGAAGVGTSIAIDSNNKVHISYLDASASGYLKYATNASGTWVISTIDKTSQTGPVDKYTSIAIDSNNKIHISYYDMINGDLKYATNQ